MTDKNNESTSEPLFKAAADLVPPSSPPDFRTLTKRVASVRRRRRIVRGVAASAAVLVGLVFASTWRPSVQVDDSSTRLAADAKGQSADLLVQSIDASDTPPALIESSKPPRIQLYASVSQTVPVFVFDEQSKTIHHVGWVESQQDVPVDMSRVSQNQQDTFNAVLHQDGDWHFSL